MQRDANDPQDPNDLEEFRSMLRPVLQYGVIVLLAMYVVLVIVACWECSK